MKKSTKVALIILIITLVVVNSVLLVLLVIKNNKKEESSKVVYEVTRKKDSESSEKAEVTEAEATEASEAETTTEAQNKFPDRANADTGEGEAKALSEGDVAPDFTADLAGGGTFRLSDYDDKVVLLNIWATWCPPCVREMPAFQRLLDDGDSSYEIICINCLEDKATVDSFIDENGYKFNIGYDTDGRINKYYPSEGIPYTVVINKGVIEKIYVGAADADTQYNEYKNAINSCK